MFTSFIRIILLIICTILSVVAAYFNIWTLLIFSALCSIVLLFGYFRIATVPLALKAINMNDYTKLERLLLEITKPERLMKSHRAYYLFAKGMLERHKENEKEAVSFLNLALLEGLKTEHFQAVALLALTDIEMVNGHKNKAQQYFAKLKNLKVHADLMPTIRQMQQYLA